MHTTNEPSDQRARDTGPNGGPGAAIFAVPCRHVLRIDWQRWTGPGRFTADELFDKVDA